MTVTNRTFSDDKANGTYGGGAIVILNGPLTVTDSSFYGNSASSGGAIFSDTPRTAPAPTENYNLFYNNSPDNGVTLGTGDVTGDPKLASLQFTKDPEQRSLDCDRRSARGNFASLARRGCCTERFGV